jgi:hypothetical protein
LDHAKPPDPGGSRWVISPCAQTSYYEDITEFLKNDEIFGIFHQKSVQDRRNMKKSKG